MPSPEISHQRHHVFRLAIIITAENHPVLLLMPLHNQHPATPLYFICQSIINILGSLKPLSRVGTMKWVSLLLNCTIVELICQKMPMWSSADDEPVASWSCDCWSVCSHLAERHGDGNTCEINAMISMGGRLEVYLEIFKCNKWRPHIPLKPRSRGIQRRSGN